MSVLHNFYNILLFIETNLESSVYVLLLYIAFIYRQISAIKSYSYLKWHKRYVFIALARQHMNQRNIMYINVSLRGEWHFICSRFEGLVARLCDHRSDESCRKSFHPRWKKDYHHIHKCIALLSRLRLQSIVTFNARFLLRFPGLKWFAAGKKAYFPFSTLSFISYSVSEIIRTNLSNYYFRTISNTSTLSMLINQWFYFSVSNQTFRQFSSFLFFPTLLRCFNLFLRLIDLSFHYTFYLWIKYGFIRV